MQNEDLKKKTIINHIYGLLNKNKLDVAYCIVLFFYFTYCTTYHWRSIDVASGFAFSAVVYTLTKISNSYYKILICFMQVLIIAIWIGLTSYIQIFGFISRDALPALLQSNTSEILDYIINITPMHSFLLSFSAIIILPLIIYFLPQAKFNDLPKAQSRNKKLKYALFLIVGLILINGDKNGIMSKYHIKDALEEVQEFSKMQSQYNETLSKRIELLKTYNLTANYNGTIIFVMGESESANLMSDYGFFINDTPYTSSNQDVVKLSDVSSTYPQTMHAVPDSLTLADYNNNISIYDVNSFDVMSVLNQVGYNTSWISAQSHIAWGSNPVTVISTASQYSLFVNSREDALIGENRKFDMEIIPHFKSKLEDKGNKFIVLHIMGNHASYDLRYPKEFDKFHNSETLDDKKFYGKLTKHKKLVNTYLNSILYVDYVLSQIYNITENTDEPAVVIYHSDHGDDVARGLIHNSPTYDYEQGFIPMYLYFNKKFIEKYPELYKNATANIDKPYYILYDPHTIFDLIGLRDKNGNPPDFADRSKSIFNADYKVGERIVKFTHTPDKYSINNDYYENTHALMLALREKYNSNVTDNIYANDVSSLGGLIEAKPLFYGVSTKILLGDKNYGALICNAKDDCSYNLTINEYLQASKGFLRKPDLHLLFFIENNSTISDNSDWVNSLQKAIVDNKFDVHNIKFVAYNADVKSKFLNALKLNGFDNDNVGIENSVGVENSDGVVNFSDGEKIKIRADINSSDENFLSLFPLETHTSLVVSYPSMM